MGATIRIGLTGSGGTGKTTLAKAASEALGIPMIHEGVREWMAKNGVTHLRELAPEGTRRMQDEVLAAKIAAENATPSFIADRTPIDNVAYCLRWLGREKWLSLDTWMSHYIKAAVVHTVETYDVIFLLPWGGIPLKDDGVRSGSKWYQLEIQMVINGLLQRYICEQVPVIRVREVHLTHRVEAIAKAARDLLAWKESVARGEE